VKLLREIDEHICANHPYRIMEMKSRIKQVLRGEADE
jgi:hypothetical protein